MKLKQTIVAILLIIVAALGGSYGTNKLGSVDDGGAYSATTTESFSNGLAYESQVLKVGNGILGSVVVTLTSNANLILVDATTTGASTPTFSTTTQALARFKTTTAGTYIFDIAFTKGLIAISDTTVGMASTTITFK